LSYFFILPAFVLYVGAMGLAIVIATVHRPSTWLRPYFVSVLLWSSIGFVLSTALFVAVFLAMAGLVGALTSGPSTVGGITLGVVLLLGPFVAAALGVGGGAVFGLWRRLRRTGLYVRIPTDDFPPEL